MGIDIGIIISILNSSIKGITMSSIKTAISIDQELFERLEAERKSSGVSRSRFFARALEEYLHRRETHSMIEALNDLYGKKEPDPEEEAFRKQAGRLMAERLNREDGGW